MHCFPDLTEQVGAVVSMVILKLIQLHWGSAYCIAAALPRDQMDLLIEPGTCYIIKHIHYTVSTVGGYSCKSKMADVENSASPLIQIAFFQPLNYDRRFLAYFYQENF